MEFLKESRQSFLGAISFYTTIQLPTTWELKFERIARWAPLIGLILGSHLGLLDFLLNWLGFPRLTRSVLIIGYWIFLTGGLHLDGVIDTADGLAVTDTQRRLQVMKDSVTGAFGVMAAVVLLLLKTVAFSEIDSFRWLALMAAAGWGRWAQVVAIAKYPYLREVGKGAFHKQHISIPQDIYLGLGLLLVLSWFQLFFSKDGWLLILSILLGQWAIALLTGLWFNHKLGGHTGDTYGAVVEWSEAFILCLFTLIHY